MGRKLKGHLSYANVMATVAVFAALAGGAYAASVAKNSVNSKSVKNDSLTGHDINESTLVGVTGPTGPAGPAGPTGASGSNAFGRLDYNANTVDNLAGEQDFVDVQCDSGDHVVGGGIFASGGFDKQHVNSSFPEDFESGDLGTDAWAGWVDNLDTEDHEITAIAICARADTITKASGKLKKD